MNLLWKTTILHLTLAALLLSCGQLSYAEDKGGGVQLIYDSSEKNNFRDGEQTDIFNIPDLFRKIAFAPDGKGKFYFVQLSDIHIYAEDEANPAAKNIFNKDLAADLVNILNEINKMEPQPSFVIITGDLVHDAKLKQFERLKELLEKLKPDIPLYLVLGNHDSNRRNFGQVFPGRSPYYSFDKGKWHFIILDSRSDGSLEKKQAAWLAEDICDGKHNQLMIFSHHPMVCKEGWEDVRPMREEIFKLIKDYKTVTWMFSGHLHYNFLAQCKYDGMPAVNLLSTTSSAGAFGYENPGYRLVCVDEDKIKATIFKTAGLKTGYRIDPVPEKWPVYAPPPFESPKKELLCFEIPDDEKYISKNEGVGLKDNYRFVDASSVLVYALPINGPSQKAVLQIDIGSDYIVETSSDDKTYHEIFRSSRRMSKKRLEWKIPYEETRDILYIKIKDRTPDDGLGAFVYGLSLYGEINEK